MNKDLDDYKVISVSTTMAEIKRQQKELKALEIIKEKSIDVRYLKVCFIDEFGNGCSAYNRWKQDNENNYLTQEEYNLLKEVLL